VTHDEWFLIAGMAAVTFAVRYPVLALVGRVKLSQTVACALKYIPPAVLAAIVAPAALVQEGRVSASYMNDFLVASIFSSLIAWWTGNLLITIVAGMSFLLIYRWLLLPLLG
jgi:branched-subunit amino acid transport protein